MSRASPVDLRLLRVSLDWLAQAITSTRELLDGNGLLSASAVKEALAVGAGLREAAAACSSEQAARLVGAADLIDRLCEEPQSPGAPKEEDSPAGSHGDWSPLARELEAAIATQRKKLFRALAITATVAAFLRETWPFEAGDPVLCDALDAADEIIDDALAGLDATSLDLSRV